MADPDGNTYGPYDLEVEGSYAEPFSEGAWYRAHDESGVVSGGELTFDGLTAQLAAIHAYSHGSWLVRSDVWEDTSPATTTSSPRRDMLVIRRTRTVGEGETAVPGSTVPLVLHGTPASAPSNPAIDEDNDELLWSWQVPGSGGTAVTGVRDHRRNVDAAGRPLSVEEIPSMADRPSSPRRGQRVFPVDRGEEYTFDGTYWRNALSGKFVPPGASVRDWITGLRGSSVVNPGAGGLVSVPVGHAFSGAIARESVMCSPGDAANDLGGVAVVPGGTTATFRARCNRYTGALITSGPVRINWTVVGYND